MMQERSFGCRLASLLIAAGVIMAVAGPLLTSTSAVLAAPALPQPPLVLPSGEVVLAKSVRPPPRTFFRIPGKHHRKRPQTCPEGAVWNGKVCVKVKRR
ncbi:hypothetical protein A7A08_00632 [Methyloligella halotolerans]|uniref:Uncharacterized protein n=1 Tax=Methyloligella halotolerans TaxID=1177755 RepID=A0A1E2S389_9HYPH|nr:hypothetical protein A7A08_00632 [Methyloligella halotolerans]